jgi:hypothetical protein
VVSFRKTRGLQLKALNPEQFKSNLGKCSLFLSDSKESLWLFVFLGVLWFLSILEVLRMFSDLDVRGVLMSVLRSWSYMYIWLKKKREIIQNTEKDVVFLSMKTSVEHKDIKSLLFNVFDFVM